MGYTSTSIKGKIQDFEEMKDDNMKEVSSSLSESKEEIDNTPFPWKTMSALCVGMLAHSVVFTSPMPFVAFMVVDFKMSQSLDNSGYWAGWITGAFMIGRTMSGIPWGLASDKWGRKPCLLWSMFNVALFNILFGFSSNFMMAVLFRLCIGLGNGYMGVAKVCVTEIMTNKEHEMKGFGILNGIWGLGLIVGPAIGGILSRPVIQYPQLFSTGTIWDQYPYLLPCLVSASLGVIAFTTLYLYLPETLHDNGHGHGRSTVTSNSDLKYMDRVKGLLGISSNQGSNLQYEEISTSSSHGYTDNEDSSSYGDHFDKENPFHSDENGSFEGDDVSDDDDHVISIQLTPLASHPKSSSSAYSTNPNIRELLNSWTKISDDDDEIFDNPFAAGKKLSDIDDSIYESVSLDAVQKQIENEDGDSVFESMESQTVTHQSQEVEAKPSNMKEIMQDPMARFIFKCYAGFCFILTSVDESMPLWAVTSLSEEGLGFTSAEVGELLASVGFGLVLFQLFVYGDMMKKYFNKGATNTIYRMCYIGVVALVLVPVFATLTAAFTAKHSHVSGSLRNLLMHISVFIPLVIFRCATVGVFATFSVIVNAAVAKEMRGTINGFVMVAGSFGNAAGPIIGSIVYASLVDAPRPLDGRFIFLIAAFLLLIYGFTVKKYLNIDS